MSDNANALTIYAGEQDNTISKITSNGTVTTFASGGALGNSQGLTFDGNGNLYVADNAYPSISEVTPTGSVSTFVSLPNAPYGLASDSSSNLYVAFGPLDTIDKITPTGSVSQFASGLGYPVGLAFDSSGNLYVANNATNTISEITPSGAVSQFASGLDQPSGLAFDSSGNLYVANDNNSNTISKITPGGTVSQFAGGGGLDGPEGLAFDSIGNLYVANPGNGTISKITPTGSVSQFASGLVTPPFLVVVPTLTWNNAGGTGDGLSWDTAQQNWNNGNGAAVYYDGSAVIFNDDNNGNYAVTLKSTVSPNSVTVSNSNDYYTMSGAGSIAGSGSLTKCGTGTLALSTANTYSGGTNVNGGLLVIAPTSSTTSALPTGALSISGGGEAQLADNVTRGNPAATSNVNISSLSIAGNGTLDIGNNRIIIDYTSDATDPIASVTAWIVSGYASGAWNGPGIITTAAQANSGTYGIGFADGAENGNPAGLYRGQIEVMYTLLGDANLDGVVNLTDLLDLLNNYGQTGANWTQGDFNYDGAVNLTDLLALLNNYGQMASSSMTVPEPTAMSLMVFGAVAFLAQRRPRPATPPCPQRRRAFKPGFALWGIEKLDRPPWADWWRMWPVG